MARFVPEIYDRTKMKIRDTTNGKFVGFSFSCPPAYEGESDCETVWHNPTSAHNFANRLEAIQRKVIKADQVREVQPHQFWAEASSLGLKPGEWPEKLDTEIGNGMPLIRTSKKVEDHDLIYVRYRQANGCVDLRIMND